MLIFSLSGPLSFVMLMYLTRGLTEQMLHPSWGAAGPPASTTSRVLCLPSLHGLRGEGALVGEGFGSHLLT